MSDTTIACIYCKKNKPRPRNGEHIVQDGLGGKTCIDCVCAECNTGPLRQLDEQFLRNSPFAYARIFLSGRGELRSPQFVPSATVDGWLDCAVRPPGRVYVLPQIVMHEDALKAIAREEEGSWFAAARRRLKERGLAEIRREVRDVPEYAPTRLVFLPSTKSKSRSSVTLRSRTDTEADSFLSLFNQISATVPTGGSESVDLGLGVAQARIDSDVNVPGRCVAKIALNLLAHYFGAEIALGEEFDPLRAYILGTDVLEVQEVQTVTGEQGFTVDQRFVGPWYDQLPGPRHWSAVSTGHTVALLCQERVLCALVQLFAGRATFAVRLGRLREGVSLNRPLPFFFGASSDGTGDEELGLDEVVTRLGYLPRLRADEETSPLTLE